MEPESYMLMENYLMRNLPELTASELFEKMFRKIEDEEKSKLQEALMKL